MFDLRQFASLAPHWYQRLRYYQELDSTNDEARRLAEQGEAHATVVLAEYQRAGRGRRGASWVSGPGDGLLFSILLRPRFAKAHWSRIALATGLGMVTALKDSLGVSPQVKWPNDIYIRERKCAGILAEAREDFVVVGVGLNVIASPSEQSSSVPAIALNDVAAAPVSREEVLASVLEGILREVDSCAEDFTCQMGRLRELCFLSGKSIVFTEHEKQLAGRVHGIGDDGTLMIEVDGETRSYSQVAEIRVLS